MIHILDIMLRDNIKAQFMMKDGTYKRTDLRGKEGLSCQQYFCDEAVTLSEKKEHYKASRILVPETSPGNNEDNP